MNLDQGAVDWSVVKDAVRDATYAAEGTPGADDFQQYFKRHGLLVIHSEDVGIVPEREAVWLIERKVTPPQYVGTGAGFTSDPWRATRFNTERQAHDHWRTMTANRDECAPVEHMFLNKPQLSDALKSCEETCGFWVKEHDRVRGALAALVAALDVNDQDGLTEFAPQMQAARAALEHSDDDDGDGPFTTDEVEST